MLHTIDTGGVLGHYFAVELVERVWEFLPMPDLLAYGNTSALNRMQAQDFIWRRTNTEVGRFCRNPNVFRSMLWKHKAVISGSVALASLISPQLRGWQPCDMDVYTTSEHANDVVTFFEKKEGYMASSQTDTPSGNYSGIGGIKAVITLTNASSFQVDVIACDQKALFSVIFGFYGTHLFNAITGRGLICLYPSHTLAHRSLSNWNAHIPGYISLKVQKAMVKYSRRGYTFTINPLLHLQHPHECGVSTSCPHTTRDIFDSGVLVVVATFLEKNKLLTFIPNTVAASYNVDYRNIWCLGGHACQVEIEEPFTRPHFVREVHRGLTVPQVV